jgi:hypothetical protein
MSEREGVAKMISCINKNRLEGARGTMRIVAAGAFSAAPR